MHETDIMKNLNKSNVTKDEKPINLNNFNSTTKKVLINLPFPSQPENRVQSALDACMTPVHVNLDKQRSNRSNQRESSIRNNSGNRKLHNYESMTEKLSRQMRKQNSFTDNTVNLGNNKNQN